MPRGGERAAPQKQLTLKRAVAFGDKWGRSVFKSATSVPGARRLPNDWHLTPSITARLPGRLPPQSRQSRALITLSHPFSSHETYTHTQVFLLCRKLPGHMQRCTAQGLIHIAKQHECAVNMEDPLSLTLTAHCTHSACRDMPLEICLETLIHMLFVI